MVVFWSFGCEASLLRMRQLQQLTTSAGPSVVVIGVHTPRFPYEEHLDEVRAAVAQHEIAVHVVHDPTYTTWNRYNPEGWPATVVVDPRGRVVGAQNGTGDLETIARSVALARRTAEALAVPGERLPFVPEALPIDLPTSDLAFPRSLTVRPNGELVVADSAHHRLLLFELDGAARVATAVAEIDGFRRPNTVVTDGGEGLYVSEQDTGAISHLDLEARRRRLMTDDLVSPTGMTIDMDGSLVVTDAGADKIYRIVNHNELTLTMGLIAGSGLTGASDGPAAEAELAQPAGIARTEVGLVFCDTAASNVRLLTDAGRVATITGNGLFDWGLVDGPAPRAMFQRPTDLVVMDDGSIVIVDTGNNRLRRLANRRVRTMGLSGLNRPSGLCRLPGGRLAVADTGNHRIVVLDSDLQSAWPLTLEGVLPARTPEEVAAASR